MSKRYKVVATVCTDKVGSECVNEYELDENDMEGFLECKDEEAKRKYAWELGREMCYEMVEMGCEIVPVED